MTLMMMGTPSGKEVQAPDQAIVFAEDLGRDLDREQADCIQMREDLAGHPDLAGYVRAQAEMVGGNGAFISAARMEAAADADDPIQAYIELWVAQVAAVRAYKETLEKQRQKEIADMKALVESQRQVRVFTNASSHFMIYHTFFGMCACSHVPPCGH